MNEKHIQLIKDYNENLSIIKRFEGGMSNYTYHVKNDETKEEYVFRIKGENGELFVNYFEEENNLQKIKDIDINSNTIYLDPKNGTKVAKYIKGHMIDEHVDLEKISLTLKSLHNSNIHFENDYDPLNKLSKYEPLHKKQEVKYNELKNEFINIYNNILINNPLKPCHNDSQIANFIIDNNEKYYLLDWEFSGNNDIYYDIASFGNKEFNDAIKLLEVYFENPTKSDYKNVIAWRMFQCLQWYNVAQAKHELSMSEKLNIPFDKVSDMYLQKAEELFNMYKQY